MIRFLWHHLNYFVFLYPLYMSFIWTIGGLIFYFRRERAPLPPLKDKPLFSIIIPAHDEAEHIRETIENLRDLNYPNYEVIAVNDGSKDETGSILNELAQKYSWLRVVHLSPNSGKAWALNAGILLSQAQFVLVIDADCLLGKDSLEPLAWHFVNSSRVGAVTGNPRIINRTSLLGKIQVGEYSSIIGLIKRSQRILAKVLTVSGVTAAFRKDALCDCGFFDADTVTEDIDMTWKLQRRFWEVRFEPRAVSWILAAETIRGLWLQRIRWAQGGLEVIKKHYGVWLDWRQRRFWPVYIEYIAAVIWTFSLGFLIVSWLGAFILYKLGILSTFLAQPFIPPAWTGSILALVCLIQFVVSLYIDSHYESESLLKYYYWVIWYPLFYWAISALTVFVGVINVFFIKKGVTVKWESPDRGLRARKL